MLYDCRGLGVTSDRADAVIAFDEAVHAFLTQSAAVEAALARTLAIDPDLMLAHALRGFLGRLSARRIADPIVDAARDAAARSLAGRGATAREALIAAALDRFVEGDTFTALARLDQAIDLAPLDAMAIKLAHSIRFQIGLTSEMRESIEQVTPHWGEDTPGYGYILGCRAFAHGEAGDLVAAETWGRAAVLRCRDDRWGAHAVAHVFEMRAQPEQAIAWLDRVIAGDPQSDGFHRHLAWHRALALIGLGQLDQALHAFDSEVWAQPVGEYRDVANAVSLLRRIEMAGGTVGARWDRVCAASSALLDDRRLAFADSHAIVGLLRGGRKSVAIRALARLEEAAAADELPSAQYPDGALALMRGLVANDSAMLDAGLANLDRLGGSIVQRDLFLRAGIEGLSAAGAGERAMELLTARARRFTTCRWAATAQRGARASVRSAAAA